MKIGDEYEDEWVKAPLLRLAHYMYPGVCAYFKFQFDAGRVKMPMIIRCIPTEGLFVVVSKEPVDLAIRRKIARYIKIERPDPLKIIFKLSDNPGVDLNERSYPKSPVH